MCAVRTVDETVDLMRQLKKLLRIEESADERE